MIVVGLTGGIGSGKTTVAELFKNFNIPIYIADVEAKLLMNNSQAIKQELISLFGKNAYKNNQLNKPFIADKIFNNKAYLDQMNAIVHPKVRTHFKSWLKGQNSAYVIKEVAIIFEHQQQSQYDLIISVIANQDKRLQRVLNRDQSTPEKVLAIMNNQMSDVAKAKLSDFVIVNNDKNTLKNQIEKIHNSILKHIENTAI
ncbi:dephospho-CoA kinase [Psychroserpens ponticola]|uniref:Dephospho-CoA kinase n=1 Tax=Psychroserpens ponticola TaxID=2932268 RepID=A0ABY7RTQ7_9FLAO|nr:dephospho-CoA kinase [Psychroserpens ponticola]WCO00505.1 dephospho-CoA kinase [Psychroserpens ponticola]